MKKIIILAAALMVGVTANAQNATAKSNLKFQKYIAKNVGTQTTFASDGVSGTVKVKVNFNADGVQDVQVVSGVNSNVDNQVVALIKRTPKRIAYKMFEEKYTSVIVPVTFIIKDI